MARYQAAPARERKRVWRPAYIHSFWWFVFANGGLVAGIFLPVHILVQGILGPLGLVPVVDRHYDTFASALGNPIIKLYLFVIVSLPLFHWAHRLRFLIIDLGVTGGRLFFEYLFYGAAVLGTFVAGYLLITA